MSVRARRATARTGPRRLLAAALAAGVLVPALLTGCAQSVDPIERLSRKAAEKVRHSHDAAPTATPAVGPGGGAWGALGAGKAGEGAGSVHVAPLHAPARHGETSRAGRAPDAYRRWGLSAPLAPAPRPPARHAAGAGTGPHALPPVVDHVRTKDRVVFLTFDDGVDRDPRFADMVRDLRLPVSVFLTDGVAGPGHDHFGRLRATGVSVQNQTLNHHFLPSLPYAEQHSEICGQQDRLKNRFGTRPRLLRPPFGEYDQNTLRAAATCGVDAVVLWRASVASGDLRDVDGGRLRPGDIVRAQFRDGGDPHGTTLTGTTARLLRRIQAQGFTVGRLEDYL
ncbi:polysaccharide deacetylase family protein [Streptomyces sp. NPDC048425]|uniref:polysaccharide deacetylase family protein n=1 Tax=Streptomyces sp. NPDC048425 TaxID=3365548 RepID=UPI003710BE7E